MRRPPLRRRLAALGGLCGGGGGGERGGGGEGGGLFFGLREVIRKNGPLEVFVLLLLCLLGGLHMFHWVCVWFPQKRWNHGVSMDVQAAVGYALGGKLQGSYSCFGPHTNLHVDASVVKAFGVACPVIIVRPTYCFFVPRQKL